MKRILAALVLTAGLAFAQAPKPKPAPAPALPAIPAASAAALAPLTAQRLSLLAQKKAVQKQLDAASLAWQQAAVAAVKAAGLDATKYGVSPDGKKFVQFGGKR